MRGCRRLERLVVIWWWQGPKLPRVLVLHDVIYSHTRCLRFLLGFPLQLHLDRRGALMCVMLGVDPMETTEKPLTTASLRRVLLLRLRPSAILVSSLVPTTVPILVLVRGCRYVVDLTVCLLRRVILPPLRLVPLPLLLLLLRRIGSVKPLSDLQYSCMTSKSSCRDFGLTLSSTSWQFPTLKPQQWHR
jgi:hypothetical protein